MSNSPLTDDELAAIKAIWPITDAEWHRMSAKQKRRDIEEFWARLRALGGNVNKLDDTDPAWMKRTDDDDSDENA